MVKVNVSSKGQIVIPKELREKYGLDQGTEVGILEYPNEIVIVPLPRDAVKAARGMFASRKSVREMLEEVCREERKIEKRKVRRKVS